MEPQARQDNSADPWAQRLSLSLLPAPRGISESPELPGLRRAWDTVIVAVG